MILTINQFAKQSISSYTQSDTKFNAIICRSPFINVTLTRVGCIDDARFTACFAGKLPVGLILVHFSFFAYMDGFDENFTKCKV
jgi:hypothetical protein